jgi:hypothetical protein
MPLELKEVMQPLDLLAALLKQVKAGDWNDTAAAAAAAAAGTDPAAGQHPWVTCLQGIWPILKHLFTTQPSNNKLMESTCRCCRFALRNLKRHVSLSLSLSLFSLSLSLSLSLFAVLNHCLPSTNTVRGEAQARVAAAV